MTITNDKQAREAQDEFNGLQYRRVRHPAEFTDTDLKRYYEIRDALRIYHQNQNLQAKNKKK